MRLFYGLVALALVGACGDNKSGGDGGGDGGGNSCLPGCPASRAYDALSYSLAARFDWPTRTLTGTEQIQLDTSASGPIVELDSAVAVTRVHAGDTDLAFAADTTANTLHVDLTGLAQPATFTVEYTAVAPVGAGSQQQNASLIATQSRDDDPCTSRVVYTDSEPNRALYWLVTKLDPSDRALWSAQVTVDPDEDVISNGARMSDTMTDGKRVVAYALDKPIPAYLMAFAAGQLDHEDRVMGTLPVSVWYRHGLVLDPGATLDAIETAKGVFESEIMPYPWDSYAVVLLPYGGGMENATITFDDETAGQGHISLSLQAHEFSHHWFGDWVTMHTYDDVWFKEGMATVLESEADKAARDAESKGRNWGTDFQFSTGDAIVDDSLHGLDKYTSGPYQRAAWLISQIRATVGEQQFFDGLRSVLHDHALDSVTGEQFIDAFQLPDALRTQALAVLPKTGTPALSSTISGDQVTFQLSDPQQLMLAPLAVATVDDAGTATLASVVAGTPTTVTLPAGGYLAIDEHDVHPFNPYNFTQNVDQYNALAAAGLPPAAASVTQLAPFLSRSAAQQERVYGLPFVGPTILPAYLDALDSDVAKLQAVEAACAYASSSHDWAVALGTVLEAPPIVEFDASLSQCTAAKPPATAGSELTAAIADGSPAALARAEYLLSFDLGANTIGILQPILAGAPTLRLRDRTLYRLYYQAVGAYSYPAITDDAKPAWDTAIEGELTATISTSRMNYVLAILDALRDVGSLSKIGMAIHSPNLASYMQEYAVCYASDIAASDADAWTSFVAGVGDATDLPAAVQALIANRANCSNLGFRRAPVTPAYAAPGKREPLAPHR